MFKSQTQIELMYKLEDYVKSLPEDKLNELIENSREFIESIPIDDQYFILEEKYRLLEERKVRDQAEEHLKACEAQLNDHLGYSAVVSGLDQVGDVFMC